MIRGLFLHTAPNVPVFEVPLEWQGITTKQYFVLDTGFTGELKITPETAQELGLAPAVVQKIVMADDTTVETPISEVHAEMEDMIRPATVIIAPGPHLAGIGLFTKFGYKAVVDCKYRTVELHRAA